MGIEGKCSSISFLYSMVVFTLNLLLQFYRPLFLSTLLAPKRVQKAQHRQNHCLRRTSAALVASVSKLPLTRWHELSYRPFAHEFSQAKISLGWALLVSNFSRRKTTRECASLVALRRAKKTFTLLSAPFTAAVACDFDSAVFFKSFLCYN